MPKPTTRPVALISLVVLFSLCGPLSAAAEAASPPSSKTIGDVFQSSPFPAPEASDTVFVADVGEDLDTECLLRDDGPITVEIDIDRVLGRRLIPTSELVSNGVLAPSAKLVLPVFDVAAGGAPGALPARHVVRFNGVELERGTLRGAPNAWKLNVFDVPAQLLAFPETPDAGDSPIPTANTLQIEIDTLNPEQTFCVYLDWAALYIEAARPTALFHGFFTGDVVWEQLWLPDLESRGFLVDRTTLSSFEELEHNAARIAAVADRMKMRFGVDRVNIVGHSRGGVEARLYAEGADDVERLIQIGAPNLGVPFVDYTQGGVVLATERDPAASPILLRGSMDFARSHAKQLTTEGMEVYNLHHPLNPLSEYIAVGGSHERARAFSTEDIFGALLAGRDDNLIPVPSAHGIDADRKLVYRTERDDLGALHPHQPRAAALLDLLRDEVEGFDDPEPPGKRLESTAPDSKVIAALRLPQRGATLADRVDQGAVRRLELPIDGRGPVAVTLMYGLGDLDLALVTPVGLRVDASNAEEWPGVYHAGSEANEGHKMEVIFFQASDPGIYTVEVLGIDTENPVNANREAFLVSAWYLDTDLVFNANTPRPGVRADEELVLEATLAAGSNGFPGADIRAVILTPDGSLVETTFVNDILGRYSATVPHPIDVDDIDDDGDDEEELPLVPGTYRIVVQASGTRAGEAFTREAFTLATVATTTSTITGPHTDRGLDTTGDSIYEYLVVDLGVTISGLPPVVDDGDPDTPLPPAPTSSVSLFAELTDLSGETVIATSSATRDLPNGDHAVPLVFSGREIFESGIDGPYLVRLARLVELDPDLGELLLDDDSDVHETAAFSHTDFYRDRMFLVEVGDLVGIDADGNGFFEAVETTLILDAIEGGGINWSAELRAPDGDWVDFQSDIAFLLEDTNLVRLHFDGCRVAESGQRGVFEVAGLLVYGETTGTLVEHESVASGFLNANRFECANNAELSVSLDAAPVPGEVHVPLIFEATVRNAGPATATNVIFHETLFGMQSIPTVAPSQGLCYVDRREVHCNLGDLDAGESATVRVTVDPTSVGAVIAEAEVYSHVPDLDRGDNRATLMVPIEGEVRARSDFNGDGFADLAMGAPGDVVDLLHGAGAVNVLFGASRGLRVRGDQLWSQNSTGIQGDAATNDFFAAALAAGDYNGDGFADLAVGVPAEDVDGASDAGAVNVLYGSRAQGLKAKSDQIWHQNTNGLLDSAGIDDNFGAALESGDFDGDGFDDLVIGIPREDGGAGAVQVLYGTAKRLKAARNQIWRQSDLWNLPPYDVASPWDLSEAGDRFGSALAVGDYNNDGVDDLAIGVPYETFDGQILTGVAHVIFGRWGDGLVIDGNQFLHQSIPGLRSRAQPGDLFGTALTAGDFNADGFDDLAIGAIGETLEGTQAAGAVSVLYGFRQGLMTKHNQFLHQNKLKDNAAHEEYFGSALTSGDFNDDGADDLVIAVAGEKVGGNPGAGAIHILFGNEDDGLPESGGLFWTLDTANIPGQSRKLALFGAAIATADFNADGHDDLAVGVPGDEILGAPGAGAVLIFLGNDNGVRRTGNQRWTQEINGIRGESETNDELGAALGGGN